MSEVQPKVERTTLEDVAREAGVSLATVDRVINRRPGVRAKTVARVEAAISRLSYRPDPVAARLARNRTFRFCFVLPRGSNTFMGLLEEQVRHTADWLAAQRAYTDIVHVDVFDPEALARTLDELGGRYDGVATIALDHPRVRAAIDELTARGVAVVTLVSDAPTSRRVHYAGIDNTAAGRTAGTLMGRFLAGKRGRVGVIAGSLALRDHAERHFGFAQVIGTEYPGLTVMPVREGRDDREQTLAITRAFLAEAPDLVGLYSIGAGNRGIGAALEESGRAGEIVFIGHDLTPFTRRFLVRGVMDAVINQDAGHEARSAARVLMARCEGEAIVADQERIRIDIFIRDNLP